MVDYSPFVSAAEQGLAAYAKRSHSIGTNPMFTASATGWSYLKRLWDRHLPRRARRCCGALGTGTEAAVSVCRGRAPQGHANGTTLFEAIPAAGVRRT